MTAQSLPLNRALGNLPSPSVQRWLLSKGALRELTLNSGKLDPEVLSGLVDAVSALMDEKLQGDLASVLLTRFDLTPIQRRALTIKANPAERYLLSDSLGDSSRTVELVEALGRMWHFDDFLDAPDLDRLLKPGLSPEQVAWIKSADLSDNALDAIILLSSGDMRRSASFRANVLAHPLLPEELPNRWLESDWVDCLAAIHPKTNKEQLNQLFLSAIGTDIKTLCVLNPLSEPASVLDFVLSLPKDQWLEFRDRLNVTSALEEFAFPYPDDKTPDLGALGLLCALGITDTSLLDEEVSRLLSTPQTNTYKIAHFIEMAPTLMSQQLVDLLKVFPSAGVMKEALKHPNVDDEVALVCVIPGVDIFERVFEILPPNRWWNLPWSSLLNNATSRQFEPYAKSVVSEVVAVCSREGVLDTLAAFTESLAFNSTVSAREVLDVVLDVNKTSL